MTRTTDRRDRPPAARDWDDIDSNDTWEALPRYRPSRGGSQHGASRGSSGRRGSLPRGGGHPSPWILASAVCFAVVCVVLTTTVGLGVIHLPALGHAGAVPTRLPVPTATATPRLPSMPVPQGTFATRLFSDDNGNRMSYYLYGPDGYTPQQNYPLMIVLHGGGERADPSLSAAQNAQVLLHQDYVQAFASSQVQKQWPCFVVAPQLTMSQSWVNVPSGVKTYTLASKPTTSLAMVDELVQSLQQIYPMIDPNRIYIGGISIGGFGTWDALERWPETFAAGWVMAGAGDPNAIGQMAHIPVWGFQGSADSLVPAGAVKLMIQAVQAAGGKACYTQYAGATHNIWDTVHPQRSPQFLAWLFSQTKSPHPTSPPLPCPPGT